MPAMQKLSDHFTGELPPVVSARTRSGGGGAASGGGGGTALSCILRNVGLREDKALLRPTGVASLLPEEATKTSSTPAATGIKPLSKKDGAKTPAEREEMENIPYREAVGALMWAATMTRLDIASAVREVAKFSDNPGRAHWKAVRRILQYIARTKDRGIT